MNNLCKQLEEDVELCEFDLICFSTYSDDTKSSIILTKEQTGFVFIQIFNEIMLHIIDELIIMLIFLT
ncbi:unnamed protein product [Adineta steineri]|uniref:Uncharacterized protein n=1 Tax=Adineta steineri TaxID=433720 RepID=A0A815WBK6_9BILA|nr:unnamed protein product [Adineta steineri]CAF1546518.1 unnamed protein product [Adineta steineri]